MTKPKEKDPTEKRDWLGAMKRIHELEHENRELRIQLERTLDMHEGLKGLTKLSDPEQKQLLANGLASLPTGGDGWRAIMLLLEKTRAIEHMAAKRPGISNDDRNFNTGRESALEDFAHILIQAKAEMAREEGE